MSGIFLSYRRDDTSGYVGHLHEKLAAHFGESMIFRDIDTIEPGDDFVEVIEKAVTSCGVLLAVIGKQWLSLTDAEGKRRLDDPNDFVRIEIAAALDQNIRVIPTLVGGARMPSITVLPDNLTKLARRNALEIGDRTFQFDVNKLIETIEKIIGPAPAKTVEISKRQPVIETKPVLKSKPTSNLLSLLSPNTKILGIFENVIFTHGKTHQPGHLIITAADVLFFAKGSKTPLLEVELKEIFRVEEMTTLSMLSTITITLQSGDSHEFDHVRRPDEPNLKELIENALP